MLDNRPALRIQYSYPTDDNRSLTTYQIWSIHEDNKLVDNLAYYAESEKYENFMPLVHRMISSYKLSKPSVALPNIRSIRKFRDGIKDSNMTDSFMDPMGVAVDSSGNVYVADNAFDRMQKFSSDGTFITAWGSQGSADGQFDFPEGVAVDSSGNVYVADSFNKRIQKFSSDGTFLTKYPST
jgi:hypothetical protein